MGLAKYYEDNLKLYDDRMYINGLQDSNRYAKLICELRCPYCRNLFVDRASMFSHIRSVHSINSPVLLINGMIINNTDVTYVSSIKSARIRMYGYNSDVCISDSNLDYDFDNDELDITDEVIPRFENGGLCEIRIDSHIYTIERYSLYSIHDDLLNDYIEEWESNLKNGSPFKPFSPRIKNMNSAESLYLRGVFNYYVACQAQGADKVNRYYEANSILKQFVPTNSLGLCIQKIIAFKFNWINTLVSLCDCYGTDDEFRIACSFLQDNDSKHILDRPQKRSAIYMEDDLADSLNAMLAFVNGEYNLVNQYLQSFETKTISDANLNDKISKIRSKMCALRGNTEEALFYNNEIKTDEFNSKLI